MTNKNSLSHAFNSLKNALLECDVKKLDELISEDYVGFSLHGTIETKKDILNNFNPNGVKLKTYFVENVEYELFDNIGLIRGKGSIAGKYQTFEFHHIVLFTDIFKLVDNKWKYYKSQVTEIKSA